MPRKLFEPGKSGNPKGRPKIQDLDQIKQAEKQIIADIRVAAKAMSVDALDTLKSALTAPHAPWAAKVTAAIHLLDRGWGKPHVTVAGDPQNPIEHRVVFTEAERIAAFRTLLAKARDEPKRLN